MGKNIENPAFILEKICKKFYYWLGEREGTEATPIPRPMGPWPFPSPLSSCLGTVIVALKNEEKYETLSFEKPYKNYMADSENR